MEEDEPVPPSALFETYGAIIADLRYQLVLQDQRTALLVVILLALIVLGRPASGFPNVWCIFAGAAIGLTLWSFKVRTV